MQTHMRKFAIKLDVVHLFELKKTMFEEEEEEKGGC